MQISIQEAIRIKEASRDEIQQLLWQLPRRLGSKSVRDLFERRIRQLDAQILELHQRTIEKVG